MCVIRFKEIVQRYSNPFSESWRLIIIFRQTFLMCFYVFHVVWSMSNSNISNYWVCSCMGSNTIIMIIIDIQELSNTKQLNIRVKGWRWHWEGTLSKPFLRGGPQSQALKTPGVSHILCMLFCCSLVVYHRIIICCCMWKCLKHEVMRFFVKAETQGIWEKDLLHVCLFLTIEYW